MCRLLLIPALLAAAPLHAQDKPAWVGVWEGTIGTLPIRACLDTLGTDGPGHGSYYYLSRLEPIALRESSEWEGGWDERAAGADDGPFWEMDDFDGRRIRGTWYQGEGANTRTLPLALDPVAWTAAAGDGPCSSDAFLGPRDGSTDAGREPAELAGWRYTRLIWRPPAHFADDVAIETFTFPSEQPGDHAILAELARALPTGDHFAPYLQCMGGSIAAHGIDGDYATSEKPVFASRDWLTTIESYDYYCGGAHPSHGFHHRSFDRQSGAEVDPSSWFGDSAVEYQSLDDGADGYYRVLPPLVEVIIARGPDGEPGDGPAEREFFLDECREALEIWSWRFGLSRTGLLAVPIVPHAYAPCAATFTVPWDELAPFLNAEGRAGLARLRED